MDWATLQPFVMVIIGVLLRTIVPLVVKNLRLLAAGKPAERFDRKYLVAPAAVIALDLIAFVLLMVTQIGFIEEIAALGWRAAILVGIGGQDTVREIQKMITGN